MADPSYSTKVYFRVGGDTLVVANGGKILVETGGLIVPNSGTQSTLTAPASTAATNSSPYGYAQAQADAIVTWIRAADTALRAAGIIL